MIVAKLGRRDVAAKKNQQPNKEQKVSSFLPASLLPGSLDVTLVISFTACSSKCLETQI